VFVQTIPSGSTSVELLPARYDRAAHKAVVEVDHLSQFEAVWLDIQQFVTQLGGYVMATLTDQPLVAAPACGVAEAVLTGGRRVSVQAGQSGKDAHLQACVGLDGDSHVFVDLTNLRRTGLYYEPRWTALVARRSLVDLKEVVAEGMFNLSKALAGEPGIQLLSGGAAIRIRLATTDLPSEIDFRSNLMFELVNAIFTALDTWLLKKVAKGVAVLEGALKCVSKTYNDILAAAKVGRELVTFAVDSAFECAGLAVSGAWKVVLETVKTVYEAGAWIGDVVKIFSSPGQQIYLPVTVNVSAAPTTPAPQPKPTASPRARLLETIQEGQCLYTVKFLLTNFNPGSEIYVSDTHSYTWCDTGAEGTQEWTVRASGVVQPDGSLIWGYKQTVPMHSTHHLYFRDNAGNTASITVTCSNSNVVCAVS
jgi:hypothetical protein